MKLLTTIKNEKRIVLVFHYQVLTVTPLGKLIDINSLFSYSIDF